MDAMIALAEARNREENARAKEEERQSFHSGERKFSESEIQKKGVLQLFQER